MSSKTGRTEVTGGIAAPPVQGRDISGEFGLPAPEFGAPGPEFPAPREEYAKPRAEFDFALRPAEKAAGKRHSLRKQMYAIAAIVCGVVVLSAPESTPEPQPDIPPEVIVETQPPQPTPSPSPPPEPTLTISEPETYPLTEATVTIRVYGDYIEFVDGEFRDSLLAETVMDMSEFRQNGYTMPTPPTMENFAFMSWIVYRNSEDIQNITTGKIGSVLTAEDVAFVKPDPQTGDRYVEIHTAWRSERESDWPVMLILDANGGSFDGESALTFDTLTPFASAGIVYLDAYPEPEKEGFVFAGWYAQTDCSGSPRDMLYAVEFFELTTDETGLSIRDWSKPVTITLYAGWAKEN